MIEDPAAEQAVADIVALNAGAGLVVAEVAGDLVAAVAMAKDALASGEVKRLYEDFTSVD